MSNKQVIFILFVVVVSVVSDVLVTVFHPFYTDYSAFKNKERLRNEKLQNDIIKSVVGYVSQCQTNVVLKLQEFEQDIKSISTNKTQSIFVSGNNNQVITALPEFEVDCQYMIVQDDEYIQIDGNVYRAGDDFEGALILRVFPWGFKTDKAIYKKPRQYRGFKKDEMRNG